MSLANAPRKPLFALFMSALQPGFGQLYNGQPEKALRLFLAFALLVVPGLALIALYLPDGLMMPALVFSLLLTLGLWIYGMADAWRHARRLGDYRPRPWQTAGLYALVLICGSGLALPALTDFVRNQLVQSFRIPSTSMEPGVMKGDILFADKRYNCPGCKHAIRRGDVAIFTYPNDRTLSYIKRIVGLPGDRVQIHGHDVSVNGRALGGEARPMAGGVEVTESFDDRHWLASWGADGEARADVDLVVPPGQVFVLGDNRAQSRDSRLFGTVPMPDVVGRARQVWFSAGEGGVRWARLGAVIE